MTRIIQMNFLHYIPFWQIVIQAANGEEYTTGLDEANYVSIINERPLRTVYDTNWHGQVETG